MDVCGRGVGNGGEKQSGSIWVEAESKVYRAGAKVGVLGLKALCLFGSRPLSLHSP